MQITPVGYKNQSVQKNNSQQTFAGARIPPITTDNALRTALSQIPRLNVEHIKEILKTSEILPDRELLGLVNAARRASTQGLDSHGITKRTIEFIDEYANSQRFCD